MIDWLRFWKSRLDPHRPEIVALLKNGSRKNFIATRFGVTPAALGNWVKLHGLNITPKP